MRPVRSTLPQAERAVLVAVEFTGERRKLTAAARLARNAAAVSAGTALDEGGEQSSAGTKRVVDLDFDASLAEFEELARSAGAEVAATLIQRRPRPDPATLVGGGKLEEIEGVVASTGADLVLFDHDLSPSQLRNLEARLPCRVIDRTQLILDIFARHARTREGQLQVELAQLEYQLPRLAGRGKAMSQLGGGIGTRGPGETQLETDRRKINLRIDHVKEQLESVRRIRRQQRQRREAVPVPVVALVGYTNAGKSTLFNALTEAGVLESSRMFATLDPKLRQLQLPSRRKILLSDTVGFIRNLPHTLVTSFRATLEEVERAELLLHVRDASSPMVDEQKEQVQRVLAELDVSKKPVIEVPEQDRPRIRPRADAYGSAGERRGLRLEKTWAGRSAGGHRRRAGRGSGHRDAVPSAAVGGRGVGGVGGWGHRGREALPGKPRVCHGTRPGLTSEPVQKISGAGRNWPLTSIGRLKGSGGGVPNHATYVTQIVGSG